MLHQLEVLSVAGSKQPHQRALGFGGALHTGKHSLDLLHHLEAQPLLQELAHQLSALRARGRVQGDGKLLVRAGLEREEDLAGRSRLGNGF